MCRYLPATSSWENSAEAASLRAQQAEGMHVAHEAGSVHRDLKPANILLAQRSSDRKSQIRNPISSERKPEIRNPKSETNPKDQKSKSETIDPAVSDCPLSDVRFLISEFVPKVTDFGLAKSLNQDSGQ